MEGEDSSILVVYSVGGEISWSKEDGGFIKVGLIEGKLVVSEKVVLGGLLLMGDKTFPCRRLYFRFLRGDVSSSNPSAREA